MWTSATPASKTQAETIERRMRDNGIGKYLVKYSDRRVRTNSTYENF